MGKWSEKMKKRYFYRTFAFVVIIYCLYIGGLYAIQDHLLFKPDKTYVSPSMIGLAQFVENPIKTKDSTIMTWYSAGDKSKPAILFFHGNKGQNSVYAPFLTPFIMQGYAVLMMEYRGFGGTAGKLSEEVAFQDAAYAFDFLKKSGYSQIVAYGYSLGCAVAVVLSTERPLDGLILTAPFSSMTQEVKDKKVPFAGLVLKNKFSSDDYIKGFEKPLLIIHGTDDKLIDYRHSLTLFELAGSDEKQLVLVDKETHPSVFVRQVNVPFILTWFEQNFQSPQLDASH